MFTFLENQISSTLSVTISNFVKQTDKDVNFKTKVEFTRESMA